jgi:hypothetical protein
VADKSPRPTTPSSATSAALRALQALGADCRLQRDTVIFRLSLAGAGLRPLTTETPWETAAGYSVGQDQVKFHDPVELSYVALVSLAGCTSLGVLHTRLRSAHEMLRARLSTYEDGMIRLGLKPSLRGNRPVITGAGRSGEYAYVVRPDAWGRLVIVAAGVGVALPLPARLRKTFEVAGGSMSDQRVALDTQVQRFCLGQREWMLAQDASRPSQEAPFKRRVTHRLPPVVEPTPTQEHDQVPAPAARETTAVVELHPDDLHELQADKEDHTNPADATAEQPTHPGPPPGEATQPSMRLPALRVDPSHPGDRPELSEPTFSGQEQTGRDRTLPPLAQTVVRRRPTVLVVAADAHAVRAAFAGLCEAAYQHAVVPLDEGTVSLLALARPDILLVDDDLEMDDVQLGELAAESQEVGAILIGYVRASGPPRLPVLHYLADPVTEDRLARVVRAAQHSRVKEPEPGRQR